MDKFYRLYELIFHESPWDIVSLVISSIKARCKVCFYSIYFRYKSLKLAATSFSVFYTKEKKTEDLFFFVGKNINEFMNGWWIVTLADLTPRGEIIGEFMS